MTKLLIKVLVAAHDGHFDEPSYWAMKVGTSFDHVLHVASLIF